MDFVNYAPPAANTLSLSNNFVYNGVRYLEYGSFGFSATQTATVTFTFSDVGNAVDCIGINAAINYFGDYHTVAISGNQCTLNFDGQYGAWATNQGKIQIRHSDDSASTAVLDSISVQVV